MTIYVALTWMSLWLCNHKLAIETGRYANIDRHHGFCDLCDDQLGDEYQLLLECKNPWIIHLKELYIPRHYNDNDKLYWH